MPDQAELKTLAFHKIQPHFTYGVNNYYPTKFFKLVDSLLAEGYSFWHPHEITRNKESSDKLLLTFDDGYAHLYALLLRLTDEYRIHPLVFIPTGYIGCINSWDYTSKIQPDWHFTTEEIERLSSAGVVFGSHGVSHVSLKQVSTGQLIDELSESKETLEKITESNIVHISYPFGRISDKIRTSAEAAGYTFGFGMQFPSGSDTDLHLGRYAVYSYDSIASVHTMLKQGRSAVWHRLKAKITNRLSGGTIFLHKLGIKK